MTPIEFVTWMKGFVQAVDDYTITPKHWSDIKEKLKVVGEPQTTHTINISGGTGTTNSTAHVTGKTPNQDVLSTNTVF